MNENPLESLKEFYTESVYNEDEAGYADYYQKAFDLFAKTFSKEDELSFTFLDVQYLSGYFIFGTGTNSVVHFHVKECPGWKFGVWFSRSKDGYGIAIKGEFFGQYEECIDKFKPTASVYFDEFSARFDDDGEAYVSSTWKIYKIFKFIKQHPLRAWAADYCYYDYNLTCVPLIKLIWEFICFKSSSWCDKLVRPILEKLMLNYTTKLFYPTIEENILIEGWKVSIEDYGKSHCPRYGILIELPSDSSEETGHYAMFIDDELKQKWNKRKKFLYGIANFFNVWCFDPIRDSITFWKKKEQEDV